MQEYLMNLFSDIGINDIVDIAIVAFILYKVIGFIRESRAEQLVKGLIILFAATALSELFNLHTLNWILKGGMTLGVLALVIVFQPELRRGLEYMGRSKLIKAPLMIGSEERQILIDEIASGLCEMAEEKTGALLVIERETSLTDVGETGTFVDGKITRELLKNIFYVGSPLHDGAAIIRGSRLCYAGCVLPLTKNPNLSKELGTRHRAGIGITENSDCLSFIVSEETGVISLSEDGRLRRNLKYKDIVKVMEDVYTNEDKKGVLDNIITVVRKKDKEN